jgi:hypothetical protein
LLRLMKRIYSGNRIVSLLYAVDIVERLSVGNRIGRGGGSYGKIKSLFCHRISPPATIIATKWCGIMDRFPGEIWAIIFEIVAHTINIGEM